MLTSLKNPLLKQVRKLHQAKARAETGWMLLEGPHLVEAALETGWPLEYVLGTPPWIARHPHLWQQLANHAHQAEQVQESLFPELVTTVNSPGILAVAPRGARPWQSCLADPLQVLVVLERIQDPGNLGTILRTAAAVGVSGVVVSPDSIGPDHPKVLRATSGQWFRQPPYVAEVVEVLRVCKQQGFQIVGTSPHAAQSLWQAKLTAPLVLLFGSEGQGLSGAIQQEVQVPVRIPQQPGVESLNLSVSVAVLLYEVARQQQCVAPSGI
ncbi:TrmH family RNA methyltransferase [Anthocerotibacter panamensis]|uniref:TrmH family RNA methyltransferase n=1 Tax=Anthocerotibacter panamensis TaxID=2857077 RepID=UPI001C401859|nr:RNA methyltransferase [Anthocerotibacter panamensis]